MLMTFTIYQVLLKFLLTIVVVINPVSPFTIPETLFNKVSNESKIMMVLHIVVKNKY